MFRFLWLCALLSFLAAAAAAQRVYIRDSAGKAPVSFAVMMFHSTGKALVANEDGLIVLPSPLPAGTIQITAVGYKTKRIAFITDSIIYLAAARWVYTECTTGIHYKKTRTQAGHFNAALKARLDSIGRSDQYYRVLVENLDGAKADSLAYVYGIPADSVYSRLMSRQVSIDSGNLKVVEGIIKKWGYPGRSLVDTPTNSVAFYVIQHSPEIATYLPLLQRAARKGELSKVLVAMMEDRALTEHQKEQIYGTQLWGNAAKDSITGAVKPVFYFYPVRNAFSVNMRRRKAGFLTTIEQYAAEMNVPYRIKKPWWWK